MRIHDRALSIARATTTARLLDATATNQATREVLESIIARDLPANPTSADIARLVAERRAARQALEIS